MLEAGRVRSCAAALRRSVAGLRVGAVLLFGLLQACSRTPPEPAPAPTAAAEARKLTNTPGATTTTSRCIAKLASAAPAVPPPALAPSCPPDPEPNAKMPMAEVSFPDTPSVPRVEVELAKTAHDVERGLMYRRSMASEHGMLFKLDGRRDHTFWMHNTCIPLDMLFVDDDGVIVGIVEGAAPLTDTTRSVGCPSVYVLEVNAGWARKRGIQPGQKLQLPDAIR